MKRMICLTWGLLLSLVGVLAQKPADAKDINAIKRDTNYLYAEITMKEADEALLGAKSLLEAKVGEWIRAEYPDQDEERCIAKATEHSLAVQTQRGDYHRAFVYVSKDDIVGEGRNAATAAAATPIMGTPGEDTAEDTPSEQPAQTFALTEEEQEMVGITDFYEVEPYVKNQLSRGIVAAYGKYVTMPANTVCHLFVYNKEGAVVAVLRGTKEQLLNLRTKQEDSLANYKGCGAIWMELK